MRRTAVVVLVLGICCCVTGVLNAQSTSASVTGLVTDPSKAVIAGVKVAVINEGTNLRYEGVTNGTGSYYVTHLPPGTYRVEVEKIGFKTVLKPSVILHVQDTIELNFEMAVGSASETITVAGGAPLIDTQSAAVSTVVDRQFVENIPLNGRSFQSLMQLTPGVVVTPTSNTDSGQFSVNGQRASANYFMVDGVSANIGASAIAVSVQNAAGTMPGLSVLGGTNNLVSVDALQEFRIQTSTYAPEFGRVPGGQVSIETRSGTNQFHGTLFEYLRNDVLDASNWFNGTTNPPLKKSRERQSDFGGVFGGPILKNRTFFFFSYEQQILRLPRTAISKVPSLAVRQDPATPASILPLLNAYPLPNGTQSAADITKQIAPFSASFSDPSTLKAASLRIDHKLSDRLTVFGRYNYSPSQLLSRGDGVAQTINTLTRVAVKTETLTLGAVWSPTASVTNDLRFNYSWNKSSGRNTVDLFGGAIVPPESFFLPPPFTAKTSAGLPQISTAAALRLGPLASELQRQVNIVDSFSFQKSRHAIKLGVDYRRLSPNVAQMDYSINTSFTNVQSAVLLQPSFVFIQVINPVTTLFHNLGAYAQDTWTVNRRISLTYGFRWDVDFAPSTAHGPDFLALTNVGAPTTVAAAPPGTSVFRTRYSNVAPRVGVTYLLSPAPKHETVLRGGFGVFYDLATQQTADMFSRNAIFPFGATKSCSPSTSLALCGASLTFPLPSAVVQPPPIILSPTQPLVGFDPDLSLPYTLQWNVALEQSLSDKQALSASYVGAVGRGLIQPQIAFVPPGRTVSVIGNHATSDYHALQLQFRRQMSRGLQALASYSWSHSIDSDSSSSLQTQNSFVGGSDPNTDRASSDFDVRHSFSGGVTYQLPNTAANAVLKRITGGWSVDSMIQGRSAASVNVTDSRLVFLGSALVAVRPDVVSGQPLYLFGPQFPGGKGFNPIAFAQPPKDPLTGRPLRDGNLGRNALRGFGAFQWDIAASRAFALKERLHLQLRAELFNVLNHPNFANPVANLASGLFGRSTQTLNQGLNGAAFPGGGFSPLYQIGGPRSRQLSLKFWF